MALCGAGLCFSPPVIQKTREELEAEDEVPLEIDYDSSDLTLLYQAIEDKAFMAAIDFLESGKPEVYDECRTWVTRYEKENQKKIRWSQLPLHAAIVFGGPPKLIQLLVQTYPKAVRCTDDRVMLPIHLAFKKEASDAVIHCLLKEFPESINAKDSRGRTPLQVQTSKKAEIISLFEENAKAKARKALTDEKISEVQKKLIIVEQLNSDLQNKNERLEDENRTLKDQVEALTPVEVEEQENDDEKSISISRSYSNRSNRSADKKSSQPNSPTKSQTPDYSAKKSPLKRFIGRMKAGTKNTPTAVNDVAVDDSATKVAVQQVSVSTPKGSDTGANDSLKETAPVLDSTTSEQSQKKSFFKKVFSRSKDKATKTGSTSNQSNGKAAAAAITGSAVQGDSKVGVVQGANEIEKTPTVTGSEDEQDKDNSASNQDLPTVETVVSEQGTIVAEPIIPIAAAASQ
jgi:hypothetical protein